MERGVTRERLILSGKYDALVERMAERNHETWMRQRQAEGWRLGPERCDRLKETPCMVPWADLPEPEREHDRELARASLALLGELGYRLVPPEET